MCGVPYGEIDVDRLLNSLTVIEDDDGFQIGIVEKGLSALESLLFARYQMYRNVYWHHAVRSATAMFKRLVRRTIAAGRMTAETLAVATDDGLIHDLEQHDPTGLAGALRDRRLAKRALDIPGTDLPSQTASWPADDPDVLQQVEERLARELGLGPDELFLDFPAKPGMLDVTIPVVGRTGGAAQHIGLPRVAAELHRSAQRLRVFVMKPVKIEAKRIIDLVTTDTP